MSPNKTIHGSGRRRRFEINVDHGRPVIVGVRLSINQTSTWGYLTMNATYEAVYRLACALFIESENTGVDGFITYRELARILNRFGYEKQRGGQYTESHGKALGQLATAAWFYIEEKYGEKEARKIYLTIRDENGKCRAAQTERRTPIAPVPPNIYKR